MPGITSKLPEGWERSETSGGIPYYINHETECTYWDHPEMVQLLQDIAALNNIKYAAYRTAMKLRAIQKKTQMYLLELPVIISSLQEEKIRDGYTEKTLTATDVQKIISTIFINQNSDRQDFINIPMASDLTFNWILNVFDPRRTGFVQSISLKIGLSFMCAANLQDKYKYLFRQLCDSKSLMDKIHLKIFLQEALQIPKNIYESAVFCGTSVEPAVRNCFERNGALNQLNLDEFLDWMIAEPQTIVWLPTLHRLAVSESVKHEAKCNICKMYPIIGFRYRCLKCFNFDLCQECFWSGRVNKGHKVGHPTQEYCLAPSQKEDIKDFAKVMKNKVSKKKKNPKDPAKGRYISIANEDAPPSSDEEFSVDASPSMKRYNSDTHDKMGSYAARLADYDEIDDKPTSRNRPEVEEQQEPLHRYPISRSAEPASQTETVLQLRSPTEVEQVLDPTQRDELEDLISNLENDNRALRDEIDRIHQLQLQNLSLSTLDTPDEAEQLRQRKERLLAREEVLESHNHQLEIQLNRLRSLLHQDGIQTSAKKPKPSRSVDTIRSTTIPYQPTPLQRITSSPETRGFTSRQDTEQVPGLYNPAKGLAEARATSSQTRLQPLASPPGTHPFDTEIRGVSTNQTSRSQEGFSSNCQKVVSQSTRPHPGVSMSDGEIRGVPTPSQDGFSSNFQSDVSRSTMSHPGLSLPNNEIRGLPLHDQQYSTAVSTSPHYVSPRINSHVTSSINSQSASPSRFSPHSYSGFGSPGKLGSSYEEEELQNIVDRMTSSFPLDAESDFSMEIHSDLFLAAAMVGEAMQSLVSAVSRQRGQDFSDSPSPSYDQHIKKIAWQLSSHTNSYNSPLVRNEGHLFDSSSRYVEEYGPL